LTCLAFGRRAASFSTSYVFYRLAQHGVPGASAIAGLAKRLGIDRLTIPVPLGEIYAVWRC